MTDHIDVPILSNGDWIDAAWLNQYLGDNFRAFQQGFANVGSIPYAVDENTIAELGKPASLGLLKNDENGVPSYLTGGSALQVLRKNAANNGFEFASLSVLHAKATVSYNASDQVITATSFQDITNATVNIITTRTCTIFMRAFGVFAVGSAGQRAFVQGMIGGVGMGDTGAPHTSNPYYIPFALEYYRTGIAAGTITCKLQGKANAGGNAGVFERGMIIVNAFEE